MNVNKGQEKKRQAYWPVLGLLLALSAGVLAYIAAPAVNQALDRSLPNFPTPNSQLNLIMTVILFVIFALIGSLIVAAAAPKKKTIVNEVKLAKERKELVQEKKVRKLRQREINRQGKAR